MAQGPQLKYDVVAEYNGKGLSRARKDVEAFSKTLKTFARTVGVSLSAAAIVQFGKTSVKAFVNAEREGVVLANTMRNLGLAFDGSRVQAYVDKVGKLYGVTGAQAVPAMQSLLSATGSVTKSQELFNTALNISASTGIEVSTVAKGLSQAFLGNRKALSQYNTGLTKTELQLKSFDEIQTILDNRLRGASKDAAETYAGQLSILTENAKVAQETIGKGLVDSFVLLAGAGGLPAATTAMEDFANATAEATLGAASLIDKLKEKLSPGGFNLTGLIPVIGGYIGPGGVLDKIRAEGRKVIAKQNMGTPGVISGKSLGGDAYFAAQAKADKAALDIANKIKKTEQDRLATIKKIAAEKAKKLALDKLSAVLNQAQKLFDSDRVSLAAAALSKQTEEDRVRIRIKTEILDLEDAIATGNVEAATRFAALLTEDARLLGQLRQDTMNFGDAPNPYNAWLISLQQALALLLAISNVEPQTMPSNFQAFTAKGKNAYEGFGSGMSVTGSGNYGGLAGAGIYGGGGMPVMANGGVVTDPTVALIGEAGPEAVIPLSKMGQMGGTTYNIYATGIGDQAIAQVVQNALQELNRYGNSTTYAGAL